MKVFEKAHLGRVVIIGLMRGDLILESIREQIDRLSIRNAVVVSGIGSACKIRYHRIDDTADWPVDKYLEVNGPIEIGKINGLIVDGVPHLHVSFADKERAYCGHLEDGCVVQYLAELTLIELLNTTFTRRSNEFGVMLLSDSQRTENP